MTGGVAFGNEPVSIKSGWEWSSDQMHWRSVSSPCLSPKDVVQDKVYFRRQLSEIGLYSEPAIFIETMSQPFEVKSNGKSIYSYLDVDGAGRQFKGYPWHMIDLPTVGLKDIEVTVRRNHQVFVGLCKKMTLGNRDELYHKMIRDDFGIVATAILLLLVGVCAGMGAYFSKQRTLLTSFAILSVAIGIWIFTTPEVKTRLFLVKDPQFWMAPGHLALFFIPPAFICYCIELFRERIWRIVKFCFYVHMIYLSGVFCLLLLGRYDYPMGNYTFNLIVPFTTLLAVANIGWLAFKKAGNARVIAFGLVIFLFFAIHDWLIGMWILNWQGLLLHWGFLVLIGFLAATIISEVRTLFSAEEDAKLVRQRFAAVSEVTQMVVHDIKRPFSLLRLTLDTIMRSNNSDDVVNIAKENAAAIIESTHQISSTLGDLLALEGRQTLIKEKIKINDTVAKIIHEFEPLARKSAVRIIKTKQFKGTILADLSKLRRILGNIIQNAIEAQPLGGEITIESRALSTNQVEIQIGSQSYIAPEHIEKIFDHYVTIGKAHGSGLGLAIVKKFVDLHHGKISCSSDPILGTTFTVLLPTGR